MQSHPYRHQKYFVYFWLKNCMMLVHAKKDLKQKVWATSQANIWFIHNFLH